MTIPKYLFYYLYIYLDEKIRFKENLPSLKNLKSDYIGYILKITDQNISEASKILKISPLTL